MIAAISLDRSNLSNKGWSGRKMRMISIVEIKIHLLYICCVDHQNVASMNNRITSRCYARHLTDSSLNRYDTIPRTVLLPDSYLSKIGATEVRG